MKPMKYNVFFTTDAEADLSDIYAYIKLSDSISSAKYVIQSIRDKSSKLKDFPGRGHKLPEFVKIRNYDNREIHFKPYRIIYEVDNSDVFVNCVLDSRRDLQEVLERRLLK